MDLEFALKAGMASWFEPPSYLEFRLLYLLAEERHKHEVEQIRKKPHGQ